MDNAYDGLEMVSFTVIKVLLVVRGWYNSYIQNIQYLVALVHGLL